METIKKNHMSVISTQASFLDRELKRSRLLPLPPASTSSYAYKLPASLQKRCPSSQNIDSMRVIDNFEVTVLYLLDEDGLIQEKNRLGTRFIDVIIFACMCFNLSLVVDTFMILMFNTPKEYMDRRILCLYLLHHNVSNAMKVCRCIIITIIIIILSSIPSSLQLYYRRCFLSHVHI
jgi:hypothetical protein